jgi:uncharacterized protein HemX
VVGRVSDAREREAREGREGERGEEEQRTAAAAWEVAARSRGQGWLLVYWALVGRLSLGFVFFSFSPFF